MIKYKTPFIIERRFAFEDWKVRWIFTLFFNLQQMASNPHESQME